MERVDAVQAAKSYAKEIFGNESISGVRLEEMNFDAVNDEWLITVSFAYSYVAAPLLQNLGTKRVYGERQYKVVRVRDRDGAFAGLTDRMLAPLS